MYNPPTNLDYLFASHFSPEYRLAYDEGYVNLTDEPNPYPPSIYIFEMEMHRWWKKGNADRLKSPPSTDF